MTPDHAHSRRVDASTTPAAAGDASTLPTVEFPRLAQLLDRLGAAPSFVASAPGTFEMSLDGPVPDQIVADAFGEIVKPADPVIEVSVPVAEPPRVDPLDEFVAGVALEQLAPMPVPPQAPEDQPDEIEQMIAGMRTRDIAREALRARFVAFGEGRQHRTAYETVFLMLAFAVMVLLAAPPLVDILLAANGVRPG